MDSVWGVHEKIKSIVKKHFQALIFPLANPIFAIHEIVIANIVKQSLKQIAALRSVRNDARLIGTKNILRQIIWMSLTFAAQFFLRNYFRSRSYDNS